jgi:hypothetical protein
MKQFGMFFASFFKPTLSFGIHMRFLTSKASLFLISLIFIFILFWLNPGNLILSVHPNDLEGSNSQQNLFLHKMGDTFSGFSNWVYDFSKPLAAEVGKSFQAWWESQKAMMLNSAVQWLVNQQDNLSSNLRSLLESILSNPVIRN